LLFGSIFKICGISKNSYTLVINANQQSTQLAVYELNGIILLLKETLEPTKRFKLPKLIQEGKNVFN
jgi:hypothetical protein